MFVRSPALAVLMDGGPPPPLHFTKQDDSPRHTSLQVVALDRIVQVATGLCTLSARARWRWWGWTSAQEGSLAGRLVQDQTGDSSKPYRTTVSTVAAAPSRTVHRARASWLHYSLIGVDVHLARTSSWRASRPRKAPDRSPRSPAMSFTSPRFAPTAPPNHSQAYSRSRSTGWINCMTSRLTICAPCRARCALRTGSRETNWSSSDWWAGAAAACDDDDELGCVPGALVYCGARRAQ